MVLQLVLIRHGQSEYNEQDRFTGWADVELTPAGRQQAVKASDSTFETQRIRSGHH